MFVTYDIYWRVDRCTIRISEAQIQVIPATNPIKIAYVSRNTHLVQLNSARNSHYANSLPTSNVSLFFNLANFQQMKQIGNQRN